jgi:transposase
MILYDLLNLQACHFTLHHIVRDQEELILKLESRAKRCRCPTCHKYSHSIHSTYRRSMQDLSCFAHKTHLQLSMHKFYCRNPLCPQKIFTERFTVGITPYKRMTDRLAQLLSTLCMQSSFRSAERICWLLHIQVSDTTLGRLLHAQSLPTVEIPQVLGVDDWAMKKRSRYGTILVDLEHHKVIDVLKDRETTTLQKWLEEHPGVQIISRDRYTNYSNAITAALPHATQVADRWHVLKNLCDGLKSLVERNHQHLKYARSKEILKLQRARRTLLHRKEKKTIAKQTASFQRKSHQLREIKVLYQKGMPLKAIARNLCISRNTVKKYLHLKEPPCRRPYCQVNIALYDSYIRKRLKEVPGIKLRQLFQEIKQRGYNGCRSTACEYFHRYVNKASHPRAPRLPDIFYLPSKISFLLLRKQEQLTEKEQNVVHALCRYCPEIQTAYGLATEFKEIMKQQKSSCLQKWIKKVIASGISELKSFAKSLLGDFDAVKNALTLPWSNGPVEGLINKLKTIKRLMYGRASFELLRKKLLLDSS